MEEFQTIRNLPEDGVYFFFIHALNTTAEANPGCDAYCKDYDAADDENVALNDGTETLSSRLDEVLKFNIYREKDITILTETTEEKIQVQRLLNKAGFLTQDSTIFPIQHTVVDTLENFEGLDSPVVLFIVPECWATGYVGSLKYRLCIATRAISRLEFLVPWDPRARQPDLAELRSAFGAEVK